MLAHSLEKYQYLVLAPRSTTIQLTHGRERQFGMLNCIATVVKSNQIHVFLILQTNNSNNRDNRPQIQQILSPTRGITRIFAIFKPFPTYTISSLVETHRITRIFGIGHQLRRFSQIIQSIHYSYRHLLNRQCSEWYWTIISMLYRQFSTAASTDG